MRASFSITGLLILTAALLCACTKKAPLTDPSGIAKQMTIEETIAILGQPSNVKNVGENKLIYIYREPAEVTTVFFVNGKVETIENIARSPQIAY
jgi:hypothetical protein